jgi:hypothetical protein
MQIPAGAVQATKNSSRLKAKDVKVWNTKDHSRFRKIFIKI